MEGIKLKKKGRIKGENRILIPEHEKEIKRVIVDKTPVDFMRRFVQ